jgi:hypothetical protein
MSASPTVNLPSLELVSTLRVAPLNGPPSSNDYNDADQETIVDLTTLLTFLNNILMPMLNTLAAGADNGVEGSNIFGDTTSEEALFYNVLTEEPMVIADSLRFLYGQSQSIDTLIGNLGVQVAALQARLSSTNQNDVALVLQGFTSNLNSQLSQLQALQTAVSSLQVIAGTSMDAQVVTPVIAPQSVETIAVPWTVPFALNTYTVSCAIEDASGFLQVTGFIREPGGVGILVHVLNTDTTASHQGTVNAIGRVSSLTSGI